MSDSEHDIDDELLELAGAGEKKVKKRQAPSLSKSSSSKRRKPDVSLESDSEDSPESEEDQSNPYPYEDKYIDAADKKNLMQMSEFDREAILAQRQEELQRIQDKRALDKMLKDQSSRAADVDSVSRAAKRQHTVRGATKEKTRKLDELKAKRKAKDERKRNKMTSPKRERSSSPMDMETSSDEEEDGQISKLEEEEEKDRKLYGKHNPEEEPITMLDLEKCRVTRDALAKHCMVPWFEDYVKGAWVRYLIGQEDGKQIYRICEISNVGADLVKPYKVNDQIVNQTLELKHGKAVRAWLMDKVSNGPFEQKEFERLVIICESEHIKLPSKRHLEQKTAQLMKLSTQPMTESDVTSMLARKSALQSHRHNPGKVSMEKARLTQARSLALRRQDFEEAKRIDAEIEALVTTTGNRPGSREISIDLLAKVNERNRKANMEVVRKAELMGAERKRKERKLAASGVLIPQDPSARLRTVPRLFNSATPSRPGTPNPGGTPMLKAQPASTSPVPPTTLSSVDKSKSFEAVVIDSIEVDLGDF